MTIVTMWWPRKYRYFMITWNKMFAVVTSFIVCSYLFYPGSSRLVHNSCNMSFLLTYRYDVHCVENSRFNYLPWWRWNITIHFIPIHGTMSCVSVCRAVPVQCMCCGMHFVTGLLAEENDWKYCFLYCTAFFKKIGQPQKMLKKFCKTYWVCLSHLLVLNSFTFGLKFM